jgi:hypothetical protein
MTHQCATATVDAPDSIDADLNVVRSANGRDAGIAAKASINGQAVQKGGSD